MDTNFQDTEHKAEKDSDPEETRINHFGGSRNRVNFLNLQLQFL